MNNETKGMIYGLLGVTAFGLTLPATRIVVPFMDPIFIGLGRAIIAAMCAILILFFFRQKLPSFRQIKKLLIVAMGVVVGFPVLASWAMQYVPASHGGVVLGILPLITSICAVIIANEKPSIAFWVVSIVGSTLVVLYAVLQGAGSLHIADIALLGAILSAAIGYAVGAELSKEMGGWQVICWALVVSIPFITIPAALNMPSSFSDISMHAYISFLYLALFSQLFGFFLWYKGLALGGIARVSQTQLLQPFITFLASVLFLGERIDLYTIIFIVLVAGIVWFGRTLAIKR